MDKIVEMNSQKILVTGGAGYIGSHACKALAAAGFFPVTIDSLIHGHSWAVQWGPLEQGDIADRAFLDSVIAKYHPIAVMHFAAFAYVGESVVDPGKYYRNNVAGTLTLLEAVRDHQIPHFVFSSTCATYGAPIAIPIPEAHPQWPINPYGAGKLMIERMLTDFEQAHGLRSVSLRYFNAAGADPDGEIGECHNPETHLIPLVLDVAASFRSEIKIFGEDYSTPDGTCIRDYIHVTDLADAHIRALNYLIQGGTSVQMNLGTGTGYSVKEVIATTGKVTGRKIFVTSGARRPGDPPQLVAKATTAEKLLGWAPVHSRLEEIIGTAWAWHQSGKLKEKK